MHAGAAALDDYAVHPVTVTGGYLECGVGPETPAHNEPRRSETPLIEQRVKPVRNGTAVFDQRTEARRAIAAAIASEIDNEQVESDGVIHRGDVVVVGGNLAVAVEVEQRRMCGIADIEARTELDIVNRDVEVFRPCGRCAPVLAGKEHHPGAERVQVTVVEGIHLCSVHARMGGSNDGGSCAVR